MAGRLSLWGEYKSLDNKRRHNYRTADLVGIIPEFWLVAAAETDGSLGAIGTSNAKVFAARP